MKVQNSFQILFIQVSPVELILLKNGKLEEKIKSHFSSSRSGAVPERRIDCLNNPEQIGDGIHFIARPFWCNHRLSGLNWS